MGLEDALDLIEGMLEDTSTPRNVRRVLEEAKITLNEDKDINVKVMKAIYSIEKITDDQNILPHVRMQLWSIISALESVKTDKS